MDRPGERDNARRENRRRGDRGCLFGCDAGCRAVQRGRRESCRVYKKRFDDELTGLLLELKWWDFSPEDLADFLPVLCETDLEKVKEILKKRLGK